MLFYTLKKLNLKVGDKIKVIGYDGYYYRNMSKITSINNYGATYYYNGDFTEYGICSVSYQRRILGLGSRSDQIGSDIKRLFCGKIIRIIPL
jgi:hypothetical protein